MISRKELPKMINHTNVRPTATSKALAMIEAGANRIGTSTGAQIMEELPEWKV